MITSNKQRLYSQIQQYKITHEASITDACRHFKISRSSYYRLLERYRQFEDGNRSAFEDKPRRPKRLARRTSDSVCAKVIELYSTGQFASANRICVSMQKSKINITTSTVIKILEEAGLYGYTFKTDKNGNRRKIRSML